MRFRFTATLLGSLLFLSGCQSTGMGRARRELKQTMDSGTNACRQNPVYCTRAVGEETVLPASIRATAQAGASVAGALKVMDEATRARVREIMAACANEASWEVNKRLFGGQTPTAEQCRQKVGTDASGNPITRAMQLGQLKHEAAMRCVQARLSVERPGGFSLKPRYRYDPKTKALELISAEAEQALLQSGRTGKLKGTLVPDVVIHAGNPLKAQEVFDFKFPCPISNNPSWRRYPEGPPHEGRDQGEVYRAAFGDNVSLVAPGWGVH
ncbi:hypothetical protein G4177_23515 [Corallococcus sp. ZKHCc1 1396]|uniref:Lipoprotein n=1 Tax=Corallococcus soli TaxID=2710757 RepID=A0ABR9PT92_9BACT|nr:hypothetical protein [Corallococcus soli]MBE4751148.1 hypothetical protein [Corallococcus soli]